MTQVKVSPRALPTLTRGRDFRGPFGSKRGVIDEDFAVDCDGVVLFGAFAWLAFRVLIAWVTLD